MQESCKHFRTFSLWLQINDCGEKVLKSIKIFVQKFSNFWGPSPRNMKTTIHRNLVLTLFHTTGQMYSLWKTAGTTFQRIIVLESRSKGPKYYWNVMHLGSQSVTYRNMEFFYCTELPCTTLHCPALHCNELNWAAQLKEGSLWINWERHIYWTK